MLGSAIALPCLRHFRKAPPVSLRRAIGASSARATFDLRPQVGLVAVAAMAPKKTAKAKAAPKKAESKKTPKAKSGKRSATAEPATASVKVPKVAVDGSKALEELLAGLQESSWKD
eukprot:s169_g12.t1